MLKTLLVFCLLLTFGYAFSGLMNHAVLKRQSSGGGGREAFCAPSGNCDRTATPNAMFSVAVDGLTLVGGLAAVPKNSDPSLEYLLPSAITHFRTRYGIDFSSMTPVGFPFPYPDTVIDTSGKFVMTRLTLDPALRYYVTSAAFRELHGSGVEVVSENSYFQDASFVVLYILPTDTRFCDFSATSEICSQYPNGAFTPNTNFAVGRYKVFLDGIEVLQFNYTYPRPLQLNQYLNGVLYAEMVAAQHPEWGTCVLRGGFEFRPINSTASKLVHRSVIRCPDTADDQIGVPLLMSTCKKAKLRDTQSPPSSGS